MRDITIGLDQTDEQVLACDIWTKPLKLRRGMKKQGSILFISALL